ncbi:MAG: hypothetical protein QM808_17780 [Steroidobacteraceae bacterium]
MFRRYENPLSGNPRTIEKIDKAGLPEFHIIASELTPERAILASQVSLVAGWSIAAATAYYLYQRSGLDLEQAASTMLVSGAAYWAFRTLVADFLRRTTKIVMTTEAVKVRRWVTWKSYRRSVPHQFLLAQHDKTQDEQIEHEYRKRKDGLSRSVSRCPVYFGNSFHVVLLYAGQRIDLLDVYGPRPAAAIVARLQYCDDALDFAIGKGHRTGRDGFRDWRKEGEI